MNKTQDIVEKLRDPLISQQLAERYMLEGALEIERLRTTLKQVLTDAQSQDVLSEWWTPMEIALTPNAALTGASQNGEASG